MVILKQKTNMSENKEANNPPTDYKKAQLQSALAVSFYMSVSIGLVFLNRIVLTGKEKAGALFVSWYQFIVAYIIIIIVSNFCQNVPLLNLFPPFNYKLSTFIKVLPVSASYLLMIGFNNKCLEYVSVSGYQIVRSLTILFNILLTFFVLNEKTSLKACLACGGVVVGFILGVEGEIGLTWKGAVFGVLSSFFVALYSIVVKRALNLLNNNEYLLIEYNTPIAIIALTPFVYFNGEFNVLFEPRTKRFWVMQTLAGIVGFVINIAIFLNIKYTTPLTHNISGTVKACLQTLLALVLFKGSEKMTFHKFIGTILTIGFSALYAYIRKTEMKKKFENAEQNESQKLLLSDNLNEEEDTNIIEEEEKNEKI